MITRLQDEAHRFAIEYHRSLRSKSQIHSVLDDIEGIGPARRKALLAYFKDIDKIRAASIADLEIPQGMNKTAATAVYNFSTTINRSNEDFMMEYNFLHLYHE